MYDLIFKTIIGHVPYKKINESFANRNNLPLIIVNFEVLLIATLKFNISIDNLM